MASQAPSARGGMSFTILGAVLAVLGFGVVFLLGSLQGNKAGASAPAATVPIVVAAANIGFRQQLTVKDVTIKKVVPDDVPPGSLTKPDQVKDLVAAVNITKGQAVTSNLLVQQTDLITGPAPAYLPIPAGYVAYTIPTAELQGVAGFIQAGDYLTIIDGNKPLSTPTVSFVSRTIFTNIHVIAVGPATGAVAPAAGSGGASAPSASGPVKSGGVSSSLTVVVTQCQAEYLNWFIGNGHKLVYSLESYKDYQPQSTTPDPSCPGVTAAHGVTDADIKARYPGLI